MESCAQIEFQGILSIVAMLSNDDIERVVLNQVDREMLQRCGINTVTEFRKANLHRLYAYHALTNVVYSRLQNLQRTLRAQSKKGSRKMDVPPQFTITVSPSMEQNVTLPPFDQEFTASEPANVDIQPECMPLAKEETETPYAPSAIGGTTHLVGQSADTFALPKLLRRRLSQRTVNLLVQLGVSSTSEFLRLDKATVLQLRGAGSGTWLEIQQVQKVVRVTALQPTPANLAKTDNEQQNSLAATEADNGSQHPEIGDNLPGPPDLSTLPVHSIDRLAEVELQNARVWQSLSVRARHGVENLRVTTLYGFLSIVPANFIQLRNVGRGTVNEIVTAQHDIVTLLTENPDDFNLIAISEQKLEAASCDGEMSLQLLQQRLSRRTINRLDQLGVVSLNSFLQLDEETVLQVRGAGYSTWCEIRRLQDELLTEGCQAPLPDAGTKISEQKCRFADAEILLTSPISEEAIRRLPFFSGQYWEGMQPEQFHPSFCGDVPISFIDRHIAEAYAREGITSLAALLLTPAPIKKLGKIAGVAIVRKAAIILDESLQPRQFKKAIWNFLHSATHIEPLNGSSFEEVVRGVASTVLDERNSVIMLMRLGFGPGRRKSKLEEIARQFGLTRERIRQILLKSTEKFKSCYPMMRPFWEAVQEYVDAAGGMMDLSKLADKLHRHFTWSEPPTTLQLTRLLEWQWELEAKPHNVIARNGCPCYNCTTLVAQLHMIVCSSGSGCHLLDVCTLLTEMCAKSCEQRCPTSRTIPVGLVQHLAGNSADIYLEVDKLYSQFSRKGIFTVSAPPKRRVTQPRFEEMLHESIDESIDPADMCLYRHILHSSFPRGISFSPTSELLLASATGKAMSAGIRRALQAQMFRRKDGIWLFPEMVADNDVLIRLVPCADAYLQKVGYFSLDVLKDEFLPELRNLSDVETDFPSYFMRIIAPKLGRDIRIAGGKTNMLCYESGLTESQVYEQVTAQISQALQNAGDAITAGSLHDQLPFRALAKISRAFVEEVDMTRHGGALHCSYGKFSGTPTKVWPAFTPFG